ncbi:hypothetical protein Tsp_07757 [Trichinella spiralis]|uniref:hypothetical protein n=1 Tax=Trichinella spiralis TaxID=6334 RepID=UPI0001EFCA0E|nr:hypothetical protein Tsp_07757 [Trichinella spiralis]
MPGGFSRTRRLIVVVVAAAVSSSSSSSSSTSSSNQVLSSSYVCVLRRRRRRSLLYFRAFGSSVESVVWNVTKWKQQHEPAMVAFVFCVGLDFSVGRKTSVG